MFDDAMMITNDSVLDRRTAKLEDCLEAVVERYPDGTIWCPITWSGGSCEECMEIFNRVMEREEE